jgi:hypothetical protein
MTLLMKMAIVIRRTGRVPDLQFDALAVQLDRLDLEVDADGGDERRRERVVAESQQEAGLAHAAVADQQQLDQEVVGELGVSRRHAAVSIWCM